MDKRRLVALTVLAVMGLLQLWDSRVFAAGPRVIAVGILALSLPVASLLLTERWGLRLAGVVACAALLLLSKGLAPHPLPSIGIVAVIALAANWLAAPQPVRPI